MGDTLSSMYHSFNSKNLRLQMNNLSVKYENWYPWKEYKTKICKLKELNIWLNIKNINYLKFKK
jgi:hypothetical protein